jgi:hypothetical protein
MYFYIFILLVSGIKISSINISNYYPVLINIAYKLLYYTSVCEIQYNKFQNYIKPLLFKNLYTVSLIDNNGNYIYTNSLPKNNIIKDLETSYKNTYIVLLNDCENNNCITMYENVPEIIDYKTCKICLINIELVYNKQTYEIKLKNDKYNFYIVNNKLNTTFFKYYLKNILKVKINDDEIFNYTVSIIDNNVEYVNLSQDNYLLFNEFNYTIFNNKTQNNEIDDYVNVN